MMFNLISEKLHCRYVDLARNAVQAIAIVAENVPDVVVIDLFMPYIDGSRLLTMLSIYPAITKIVVSSNAMISDAMRSKLFELGACAFFDKQDVLRDPDRFRARLLDLCSARQEKIAMAADGEPGKAPVAFPVPHDEQARLRMLDRLNLANQDVDMRLDILVRHFAAKLSYPMVVATLVDRHKLWVKAAVGTERRAYDRGDTFCARTICCDGPLIVPDAREDASTRNLSSVTGDGGVLAYAGVPIRSRGVALGAIGIGDTRPRRPRHHELSALVDAAALAGEFLEKVPQEVRAAA